MVAVPGLATGETLCSPNLREEERSDFWNYPELQLRARGSLRSTVVRERQRQPRLEAGGENTLICLSSRLSCLLVLPIGCLPLAEPN